MTPPHLPSSAPAAAPLPRRDASSKSAAEPLPEALEALAARLAAPLFPTVLGLLGDAHRAELAMGELVLAGWESLSREDVPGDAGAKSLLRLGAARLVELARATSGPRRSGAPRAASRVASALDALGVEPRIAFVLCELGELSPAEVAAACGVSVAEVRKRVHEAKLRLARGPELFDT